MSWFRNVFNQTRRLTGLSEPEENNHRDEIDQEEEDPENIGFLKVKINNYHLKKIYHEKIFIFYIF